MSATQTHNPAVTRAAERYLEQYGEPMVMNSYLKLALLALTLVCVMLGALTFKSHRLPQLPVQAPGSRKQVLPRPLGDALLPAKPVHH